MLRRHLAALAAVALLTLVPEVMQAQVPINPITPRIDLLPDLIATMDNSTRVVFRKFSMTVSDDGTTALRAVADMAQCAGLTAGQSRNVDVPPLRWGASNGLVPGPNPTCAPASQFSVSLSYTTVTNGVVAEVRTNSTIDALASGSQRLFDFTTAGRPTTYSVSLFTEPARRLDPNRPTSGTKANIEPVRLRTFCVPSIEVVDRAMVITADAAARVSDSNRANNVLRVQ